MSITYAETLNSIVRPSSPNFDALASSPGVVRPRVIVERYNPDFGITDFTHNTSGTSRSKNDPFDVAYDTTHQIFLRAYINSGNVYADDMLLSGSAWRYTDQSISNAGVADTTVAPKVIYNTMVGASGYFQVFYLRTDGKVGYFEGSDAITGASGTFTPAVSFNSYGTVEHLSVVQGASSPYVYIYFVIKETAITNALNTRKVYVYYSGNGQVYDTGIWWGQALTGFDAIAHVASGYTLTHMLFMATETPCTFTFKEVSGNTPQKQAQHAGGVIGFIVTPPVPANSQLSPLVSKYYPVHVFDNVTSVQYRKTVKATWGTTESNTWIQDYTERNRTLLWTTTVGRDGDLNVGDASNFYNAIFLYSSADGKHWSQDCIVTGLNDSLEFDRNGIRLIVAGSYVYLIGLRFTYRSKGCAMFHNTHADNGLDITRRIVNMSMDWNEGRATTVTLDNKDAALTSTILGTPCTLKMTVSIGNGTDYVQVSVQEVDTTAPSRQQPNEYMELNARDYLSWLNDRVVSPDAQTFDNYTLAVDNFANIAGQVNTGLAHTAVVAGAMGTNSNRLFSLPTFKESLAFSTFQSNVESFMAHTLFKFYPPSFLTYVGGVLGQTPSSSNAPTYAGIVFYAADKDNFWFVRYNYWTSRTEFGKRVAGSTTVLDSQNPGTSFTIPANAGGEVGLRIEVKDCVVRVYWAAGTGSRDFTYQATEYCKGAGPNETPLLKGYVGLIACGYSDEDQVTQEFGSTALLGIPS